VLAEPGQAITPDDLSLRHETEPVASITRMLTPEILSEAFHSAKDKLVAEFERLYLRRLVHRAGGNLARAARLANVDRTTLYRLIEKHGIGVRRGSTVEVET